MCPMWLLAESSVAVNFTATDDKSHRQWRLI